MLRSRQGTELNSAGKGIRGREMERENSAEGQGKFGRGEGGPAGR